MSLQTERAIFFQSLQESRASPTFVTQGRRIRALADFNAH